MKFFVVAIFVIFFTALAKADEKEITARIAQASDKCKKELNAKQDVYSILNLKVVPATEKQKCFLECVYKNLNLIKDNQINSEGAVALAKARFGANAKDQVTKAETMITKCKVEAVKASTTEKCALGRVLRNCVLTYGGDIEVFPKQA